MLKDHGEQTATVNFEIAPPSQLRQYIRPKTVITPAQKKVYDYLKLRGFSKDTWERRQVGESDGNIAFPYYENGELVLVKFRKPEKYVKGQGKKAWREDGGKPVFWGMDMCNPELPLVITEGEFDTLALDECGVENVVSVPSGAEDLTCIDNCWDWINQFNQIIIWPDTDEPGQEMCRKLINRLGAWRCLIVKSEYKDANESLYKAGKETTKTSVYSAEYVPIAGLVRLADVKYYDPAKEKKVLSSISKLNEKLGGYGLGQLSIWTGTSGSGKSTFLGQELVYAIKQGYSVMAYSGELPAALFRHWIELQAAGPKDVEQSINTETGFTTYKPTFEIQKQIRTWYAPYFYLLDSFGDVTSANMLEVFEYAARRHGCQVFLVDNLMTTSFSGAKDDFYRKQSEFIGQLIDFANRHSVHVHLVAHPRKQDGRLTKNDVGGSGDITSRAHKVFAIHKLTGEEIAEHQCAAFLTILKDRMTGVENHDIKLQFEPNSKRFWREETGANFKLWG